MDLGIWDLGLSRGHIKRIDPDPRPPASSSAASRRLDCDSEVINNRGVIDPIVEKIEREVASWGGVSVSPHRYGGIEFRVGRRELGHLHGSRFADLPFPIAVRTQLVQNGQADPHHILPRSGWVTRWISGDGDVDAVISLFRLNYDRPWLSRGSARDNNAAG